MIGTPYYLAPEALQGHSSLEADLWSVGVLMCVLLSGSYPHHGETPRDLLYAITFSESMKFEQRAWKRVSKEGKDLVS